MAAPAPELCPQCLAKRVIATVGGPTCTHQPAFGAKWWPADWDKMGEAGRAAWWQEREKQK